ncbi:hypothetical protein [Desulfobotulus mexicanus]|uniref:DUF8082 domain-containing protein n=1 Tax=Desulfobotulus mexicanus TaxID=2586642 RepID=A0A5Q4VGV7_9BACT|nr:hypothetical protein [Desulfobotulus mexicanus]TYT75400.1 hypothetical protein FIM25_04770 [Desulfobotulus mexicanus]
MATFSGNPPDHQKQGLLWRGSRTEKMTFSGNPATIIFRQKDDGYNREISMDRDMLKVFSLIDGKRNLSDIASQAGISTDISLSVAQRLLDSEVIELTKDEKDTGSSIFMDFLEENLSIAIGPIASVIIEDEIELMNESWNSFPMDRAPELVNMVAKQIPREEKRVSFQQSMIQFLKDMSH